MRGPGTDRDGEAAGDDGTDVWTEGETTGTAGRTAGRVPTLLALGALVLVVGLVLLGVGWAHGRQADRRVAQDRDDAVNVASQVLVNAYSFDHRDVDGAFERLRADTTGEFRAQQDQYHEDVKKQVVEQKAVTRATVGNAAVEEFDHDAGTAKVLFVFTAQSEREKLPSVTARQAAVVGLQREDDRWKVATLTPVGVIVPVGESSGAVTGDAGQPAAPKPSAAPTSAAPKPDAPKSSAPAAAPKSSAPKPATPATTAPGSSARPTR